MLAGRTTTSQRLIIIIIAVIPSVAVKGSFHSKQNLASAIRPIGCGPNCQAELHQRSHREVARRNSPNQGNEPSVLAERQEQTNKLGAVG
jgi:hypothetical protein